MTSLTCFAFLEPVLDDLKEGFEVTYSFSITASDVVLLYLPKRSFRSVHVLLYCRWSTKVKLSWKPVHIPLACSLHISDNHFEGVKIESCYRIKRYVKQYQSPFKESINRVSWYTVSTWWELANGETYLLRLCEPCVEWRSRSEEPEYRRKHSQDTFGIW